MHLWSYYVKCLGLPGQLESPHLVLMCLRQTLNLVFPRYLWQIYFYTLKCGWVGGWCHSLIHKDQLKGLFSCFQSCPCNLHLPLSCYVGSRKRIPFSLYSFYGCNCGNLFLWWFAWLSAIGEHRETVWDQLHIYLFGNLNLKRIM